MKLDNPEKYYLPYSGKFSRAEQSTIKSKLVETPTHRYFTCKACGGCGFLAMKCDPENFSEGSSYSANILHPRKFPAYTYQATEIAYLYIQFGCFPVGQQEVHEESWWIIWSDHTIVHSLVLYMWIVQASSSWEDSSCSNLRLCLVWATVPAHKDTQVSYDNQLYIKLQCICY